jgi:hypothetical protein
MSLPQKAPQQLSTLPCLDPFNQGNDGESASPPTWKVLRALAVASPNCHQRISSSPQ